MALVERGLHPKVRIREETGDCFCAERTPVAVCRLLESHLGAGLQGMDGAPLATSTKSLSPCSATEARVWGTSPWASFLDLGWAPPPSRQHVHLTEGSGGGEPDALFSTN